MPAFVFIKSDKIKHAALLNMQRAGGRYYTFTHQKSSQLCIGVSRRVWNACRRIRVYKQLKRGLLTFLQQESTHVHNRRQISELLQNSDFHREQYTACKDTCKLLQLQCVSKLLAIQLSPRVCRWNQKSRKELCCKYYTCEMYNISFLYSDEQVNIPFLCWRALLLTDGLGLSFCS